MKKLFLYHNNSSCDFHRIVNPFKYIQDFEIVDNIEKAEIVYFNRLPLIDTYEFIKLRNKLKFKYIVDFDDYWQLYHQHPLNESWVKRNTREKSITIIKHADYVVVTNEQLYKKVLEHNTNCIVVPNALPFDKEQFNYFKIHSNEVRFLFSGSIHHTEDVKVFDSKIFNLLDINVSLAGYHKQNISSEQIVSSLGFKKAPKLIPNLDINNYMESYNLSDVLLVPLANNEFNKCKSNLKILEAGCKYNHVITQKMLPYYNSKDWSYIDFASNKFDWLKKIKYCKENKHYIIDKGLELGTFVRENYELLNINKIRVDLINSL